MVGTAGRSKGCLTCKKRRVKCDEAHPTCARCKKAGFACDGYATKYQFVSQDNRLEKKFGAVKRNSSTNTSKDGLVTVRETSIDTGTTNIVHATKIRPSSALQTVDRCPSRTSTLSSDVPGVLDFSAFRDDMIMSFTIENFLCQNSAGPMWLDRAVDEARYPLANTILKAVSNQFFGKINHIPQCRQEGIRLYVLALQTISRAMSSDDRLSTPILVGVMLASFYELITSNNFVESWQHLDGVARILELRGPEAHCGDFELKAFAAMRTLICIKCLFEHKRTFLERSEWKTIPWSLTPVPRSLVERIWDLLCDMPGLWEDTDVLGTMAQTDPFLTEFSNKLQHRLVTSLALMRVWRDTWDQERVGKYGEGDPIYPRSPVEKVMHFENLEDAVGLIIYHAGLLVLHAIVRKIFGLIQDLSSLSADFCMAAKACLDKSISHGIAKQILSSVEYFLTQPCSNLGALAIIFPLKQALDVLPKASIEPGWTQIVLEQIQSQHGFSFAGDILWPSSP